MSNNYKRKVERILYSYPALVAATKGEDFDLFPPITQQFTDGPGGGSGIKNTTEKFGILRAEKKLKVEAINRGLEALTFTERELIEAKYFNPDQLADRAVSEKLAVGSTTYYKFKEQALNKMAIVLNII